MNEKIPELGPRLWETTQLGKAFEINASVKSSGRDLNIEAWENYLKITTQKLKDKSKNILSLKKEERENQLKEINNFLENELNKLKMYTEFKTANKKQKNILQTNFYKNIKTTSQYQQASSYYTYQIFKSEKVKDLLGSKDPDLILETLNQMKLKTQDYFIIDDISSIIVSGIRDFIPSTKILLEDKKLFPIRMIKVASGRLIPEGSGAIAYRFKPLPRRIHGIWKGIALGECVGGNCHFIDELTPERWATVAVKNSQFHHLEKNNSYAGFIETIPGEINGKTYASVGFGTPDLRKKIVIKNPVTQETKSHILFEEWIKQAKKQIPTQWEGLVVSNKDAINNAGVLPDIRKTSVYVFGDEIKINSGQFKTNDPITNKIIKNSKTTKKPIFNYSGNMIFDAAIPDVNQLRLLSDINIEDTTKPHFLKKFLSNKSPYNKLKEYLEFTDYNNLRLNEELQEIVEEHVSKIITDSELYDRFKTIESLELLTKYVYPPKDKLKKQIINLLNSNSETKHTTYYQTLTSYLYLDKKEIIDKALFQNSVDDFKKILQWEKELPHFELMDFIFSREYPKSTTFNGDYLDKYIYEQIAKNNYPYTETENFWEYVHRFKKTKEHIKLQIRNNPQMILEVENNFLGNKKVWDFILNEENVDVLIVMLKEKSYTEPLDILNYQLIKALKNSNLPDSTKREISDYLFSLLIEVIHQPGNSNNVKLDILHLFKKLPFLKVDSKTNLQKTYTEFISKLDLKNTPYYLNEIIKSEGVLIKRLQLISQRGQEIHNQHSVLLLPENLKNELYNMNASEFAYTFGQPKNTSALESMNINELFIFFKSKKYNELFQLAKKNKDNMNFLNYLVEIFQPNDIEFNNAFEALIADNTNKNRELAEKILSRLPNHEKNLTLHLKYSALYKPNKWHLRQEVLEHINKYYPIYSDEHKRLSQNIVKNLIQNPTDLDKKLLKSLELIKKHPDFKKNIVIKNFAKIKSCLQLELHKLF